MSGWLFRIDLFTIQLFNGFTPRHPGCMVPNARSGFNHFIIPHSSFILFLMITLGIDSGTQSTKTVALDTVTGELLASAQQAYGFVETKGEGAMEQDPAVWIAAVESTIGEVLGKLGNRRSEVAGIGVSGQQHGLVLLDANDQVVRPAKLWCDTSTTAECTELTAALGGAEKVVGLTGNAMLTGYTAPKILWVRKNEPQNWEKTASVLLPHDYINWWLTGVKSMEYGDASGTALLDVKTRGWAKPVLDAVAPGMESKLPPLRSSSVPVGTLRTDLASQWNITGTVTVSSGGGDNMMGAIGTGNVREGIMTASLGTSGTLYAFSPSPVVDPKGEVAAFCDSTGSWMPLACTMNVTLVTELARSLFEGWDHERLGREAASVPAGSEGLLMLPYLAGERTPNLPRGSGVLHGITVKNFTPAHIARAAMEGVTLGLAYGLERFRTLSVKPTEIRLTGGGTKSPFWRQLCADVFGVPTVCLVSSEGAALGAAVQAAWAAGGDHSEKALHALADRLVVLDETTRCIPDPKNAVLYAELLGKADKLRSALSSANLL
jgi:xylulokinase